jgi:protein-S-isoprenylcysteine O-methyltransferase Ste14
VASHLEAGRETGAEAARGRAFSPNQRAVALAYGIACHVLFVAAISSMIFSIDQGLRWGIGPFRGAAAWVANLLLVMQFPLLHSWLLSRQGRRFLNRLAPFGLGRDLATTSYTAISSLQLLVTFGLWSPSQTVWWRAEGGALLASSALYAGSWLLLLKAMFDSGIDLQSGFCGWGAVIRNRRPQLKPFPTHGLYRHTRQPVYVAFFLTLWTAPVWTPDRLLLAGVWTLYCWFGPLLKEHRYLRFQGDCFRRYQSLVPYWWPNARACPIPLLESARSGDVS